MITKEMLEQAQRDFDAAKARVAEARMATATRQPNPKSTKGAPIWDLVIADMHARDHVGRQKYGTPLQAHNGRDVLQDAYEEALDLAVYLRQAIEERRG